MVVNFGLWLLQRGNRESTIERKLRHLKQLHGTPQGMVLEVLSKPWVDKNKFNALNVVYQYAEFLGVSVQKAKFRVYDNREMYVPTPEMVKQFIYRIRNRSTRARIKIAIETGASAGEVWRLTWKDFNALNKTLCIIGNKGHRTLTYNVSEELAALLLQMPKQSERIFFDVNDPSALTTRLEITRSD